MRILLLFLFCLTTFISKAQPANNLNLMPVPKSLSISGGRFALTPGFNIAVKSNRTDSLLFVAVNRMYHTLNRRTGLFFVQRAISKDDHLDHAGLVVTVKQKTGIKIGQDESYQLNISDKQANLEANTTIGALRGLETILQLLTIDESGYYFPLVAIQDAPRFVWRGLMIDVSRHFIPMETIKRNIDAMAAVKMNVLHLHLSDDQGFRVESKLFPKLQSAGSNGEYYTQIQIREMVSYAGERGIIIVPEFDMPGHATSWFAGYPELATQPGPYLPGSPYKLDRSQPVSPMKLMQTIQTTPFPTFNPSKESVYKFLDRFIGEMSTLFPAPYFHIGADENNGVAWKQDSGVVVFMRKNNFANTHELQAYFVSRVHQLVSKYGKRTIGWDELFSKNLPKDVIVQVWTPTSSPALPQQIASQGNSVIISKGLYLDHFLPAYIHYKIEFPSDDILGAEAAQWTEIADAENIETRMWPRAAAIAERCWSPKTITDSIDMYRRLFIISDLLTESGLSHMNHYDRMVLRFSAGFNYQATRSLLDVLTPVKGYKRLFGFIGLPEPATYPGAPLIRAADIAMTDPRQKWEFRRNVADFLLTKSPASAQAIRDQLTIWSVNYDQLRSLFKSSPLAKEIELHSKNISALSFAGLEAIDMIKTGRQPDAKWIADKQTLLQSAKGSYGEVELSVLPELSALITQQLAPLPQSFPLF